MIMLYLQEATANTTNYMIAGFSVIFGVMLIYIASLYLRFRKQEQELSMMLELEDESDK